jgi:hypothetical protein
MTMRTFKLCLLSGALALAAPALAVAQPAARAPYKASRELDGHPDLQGDWSNASLTRLERQPEFGDRLVLTPADVRKLEGATAAITDLSNKPTDPNATVKDLPADCSGGRGDNCNYNAAWTDPGSTVMRVAGQPRSSFITSTPDGRLPPAKTAAGNPGGRPRLPPGRSQNDNPETRALGERCLTSFGNSAGPVMLPLLYNNTYQIVQTKDEVAILVEMVHDVRHVRMNAKEHLPASYRPWFGDSIGRWEGETLVVETTNFSPKQAFRGSSENLKVTERFTRVAKDHLLYQFKVEDPTVWDTAWSGEYEFTPAQGAVYEYACHEGNYGLEGILAGARAEEAAAAGKTAAATRTGG